MLAKARAKLLWSTKKTNQPTSKAQTKSRASQGSQRRSAWERRDGDGASTMVLADDRSNLRAPTDGVKPAHSFGSFERSSEPLRIGGNDGVVLTLGMTSWATRPSLVTRSVVGLLFDYIELTWLSPSLWCWGLLQ
jgi:hypothetical protein